MRAAVFHGAKDIRIDEVPDPSIEAPTDALVQITHACICGSDLWPYRGVSPWRAGMRTGHEWMGIVTDVGSDVGTLSVGDRVLAPFTFSDGTCEFCRKGLHTSCPVGSAWGGQHDGGQGEAVRAPYADGTLVKLPADLDDATLSKVLPLTDVMSTGHHAAVSAGVTAGGRAVVVGDGAVGLCGVLAARRLGAEQVIALGHHADRLDLALQLGATDVIASDDPVEEVRELTKGGAESVLECVGVQQAVETALDVARDGGTVGYVGVPAGVEGVPLRKMFGRNIGLRGGVAPVRAYVDELLADVLAGTLDPSPVLDMTVDLSGVPDGYTAMDQRQAIKVQIRL
jgi:alcohol dehydrogenase